MSIARIMLHAIAAGLAITGCAPLFCKRYMQPRDALLTGLLIALLSETIAFVGGAVTAAKGLDVRACAIGIFAACVVSGAGIIKARHNLSLSDSVYISLAQSILAGVLGFGLALLAARLW